MPPRCSIRDVLPRFSHLADLLLRQPDVHPAQGFLELSVVQALAPVLVDQLEHVARRGHHVPEQRAVPAQLLRNHPEAVKLLLNNNANVNLKNKSGYTPLDYATANKRTEITKLLKLAGALSGKTI